MSSGPSTFEVASAAVFGLALVHVALSSRFERLAKLVPSHAGLFHLLGETEVVFGAWAAVLFAIRVALEGAPVSIGWLEGASFREPLFVFAVMVVAGSRPVVQAAEASIGSLVRILPFRSGISRSIAVLGVAPLLGSFITEPAAMTVAALLLGRWILLEGTSVRLRMSAVAVLFVNVSIGGVLTNYSAPPVLMVAHAWGWDTAFMATTFGTRASAACLVNAAAFAFLFRKELVALPASRTNSGDRPPLGFVVGNLVLLAAIVAASHHTVLFLGAFLFFLGFAHAYARHHSTLLVREGLLVGFFLAGLVVLGSAQQWWLGPLVGGLGKGALFLGTAALTAFVDNAALTYMGSLLPGTDAAFRYFLVAGAVAGGGLTVIANAPNPAGASILREWLPEKVLDPVALLLHALPPTLVALAAFSIGTG